MFFVCSFVGNALATLVLNSNGCGHKTEGSEKAAPVLRVQAS
jgi:hypothetical protein